ncbi:MULTISPECIES: 5'-3' exonuclease H3TH domain-containing protein [Planococcus]|uniref:5'-3' exonuclease n=1 Tax=Planococcus faecalis TaxID=1598147 RepID=A0ABM6IQD4_9BACL|nr:MULTISPECIES: 5'-3' exonuclease H3TH domain-containing protein [Planococcus]AQU78794.1 flap endonuclease [Planococcus faecalis]MDJ0332100.1 5'-3' exonuclease H3TH domain-containing protein [Planococcus sp. S3-L1]
MEKPHVLLIDGMALLFRSFFATSAVNQYFRTTEGLATNGVQGFTRHVLAAKTMMKPTHMAVCWDMGSKTFRTDLFDGYKANRPAPPEDMVHQFDWAQEISEQLGWKNYGEAGIEADDFIGSFTKQWQGQVDFTIITGDKDMLQLLSPSVKIAFMKKGFHVYDVYTDERFIEEYGIQPSQFADVKAFMGDPSDGYPGVKGIGPKTALQLIQTYGSTDGVLRAIDELKPAQKKKIEEHKEMLLLSKKLAVIKCDIQLDMPLDELVVPSYTNDHIQLCRDQQLLLLAKQLEKNAEVTIDPWA